MAGRRPARAVPDADQRLAQALAQLDLTLTPGQSAQLLAHLALLAKWNAVYNLTAVRDPAEMLTQHLFDCLAVLPALRNPALAGRDHLAPGAVVLDVGSGGGLPGVVLAICAPQVSVHCVDAVAKKAAFLRQVRAELDVPNLYAHHARIEQLTAEGSSAVASPAGPPSLVGTPAIASSAIAEPAKAALPPATLIVSRAFASLADFVTLTQPLLASGGHWAAMKGALPTDELQALPGIARMAAAITLQVPQLDARRHLVLLERAAG